MKRCFRLGIFLVCAACSTPAFAGQPPNVLFIIVDDLRTELGVYGATHIKSPSIDALAAEGVRFENAYTNVPVCGASRASILTGLRPTRDRFVTYYTRIDEDAPDAVTLHSLFNSNGYHTESIGKVLHHADDAPGGWSVKPWHPQSEVSAEVDTGFRDYQTAGNIRRNKATGATPAYESADVADDAYFDGKIANRAIASLQKLKESGQPFFLAVGFVKPHLPFTAPAKYWDLYDESDINLDSLADFPETAPREAWHDWGELRHYDDVPPAPANLPDEMARKLIHGYYAAVSYTDAQVGRVLAGLRESGLADNTIVVLIGDHGWSLGDHTLWAKHSPFDVATHTPLIVKVPGRSVAGAAPGLVEFVDIYPTLVELADLPDPGHMQGKSFVAQLEDPAAPGKEAVFPRWYSGEVVKTQDYALTEWFDESGKRVASMLYDHNNDRDETLNLVGDKNYEQVIEAMRKQLMELH